MSALLEVRDLVKVYPGVTALAGVDLDVEAGEVHCLVGQNGAGKSTLIKCVAGAALPTSGTIRLLGGPLAAGQPDPFGLCLTQRFDVREKCRAVADVSCLLREL